MFQGSWKTTVAGLLSIVSAAVSLIAQPLLDADPLTVPNYSAFIAAAMAGFGLIFARDNNVTSKQANAE